LLVRVRARTRSVRARDFGGKRDRLQPVCNYFNSLRRWRIPLRSPIAQGRQPVRQGARLPDRNNAQCSKDIEEQNIHGGMRFEQTQRRERAQVPEFFRGANRA